jgi:putative membrane protein
VRRTTSPTIAVALAALLVLARVATAAAEPHVAERSYLLAAMAASLAQVEVGRLAAEEAQDEQVREFARRMVDHHERSRERLAQLAQGRGLEPLEEIDPVTRRWLEALRRLEGPRLDASYASGQVFTLYSAGWVHKREARHGSDGQLRAEAERQAGDAEDHHRTAQRLAASLEAYPVTDGLHPEDHLFLDYAMDTDLTQVRLGELVAERASDERVRRFARRMVDDHGRSYDRLAQAAREGGVAPLEEISPVAQRTSDWLQGLTGSDLDWGYATSQVIQHYWWSYPFEHEEIHGRDETVRELAAEGVRLGKGHHDVVLEIVRELGSG